MTALLDRNRPVLVTDSLVRQTNRPLLVTDSLAGQKNHPFHVTESLARQTNRPAISWVHYTTNYNTQSSAPDDG